jgi:hypothetical protein
MADQNDDPNWLTKWARQYTPKKVGDPNDTLA